MNKNSISVRAHSVKGSSIDVLADAAPPEAIENYFMPDMRPLVEAIVIRVITEDGQTVTLSIGQESITANVR